MKYTDWSHYPLVSSQFCGVYSSASFSLQNLQPAPGFADAQMFALHYDGRSLTFSR